jgi:hypothetical protein
VKKQKYHKSVGNKLKILGEGNVKQSIGEEAPSEGEDLACPTVELPKGESDPEKARLIENCGMDGPGMSEMYSKEENTKETVAIEKNTSAKHLGEFAAPERLDKQTDEFGVGCHSTSPLFQRESDPTKFLLKSSNIRVLLK